MKIASNTPASFGSVDGFEFVVLGEDFQSVDAIALMLQKNWGSASVAKIKALTHWVSLYPPEVPCSIIGCESTIPDDDIWRYVHAERDAAVKSLCEEVLARGGPIGVRGGITYRYLTEILGFSQHEVFLVWEARAKDNFGQMTSFVAEKCPSLAPLVPGIVDFQARPEVLYERPILWESSIVISKPTVERMGPRARLSALVRIDGESRKIWCETELEFHSYLLSERADAFVCAILPFALRSGKKVVSEAPITEYFLHNIVEFLIPILCSTDPRLRPVEIDAFPDNSTLPSGEAVGTGMSGGVDSFYTVELYANSRYKSMQLTHLYVGNYLYGNEGPIYDRAESVAQALSLQLVRTATNVSEAVGVPHLYTHFFKTLFGVLALRKLFRIYYYSSAGALDSLELADNGTSDTSKYELLLLYVFSCSDFQVVSGGGGADRPEKTRAISTNCVAREFLNVCLHPELERNCGQCEKCIRTLLTLDMLGALDDFALVFDVDDYRRNRLQRFVYLVGKKESSMLAEVYKHFLVTEPLLIERAESIAVG